MTEAPKTRTLTLLDGPMDGRKISVRSGRYISVPLFEPFHYEPPASSSQITYREFRYEQIELRKDVWVGVPEEWVQDAQRSPRSDLFTRICARLCLGYVGEGR